MRRAVANSSSRRRVLSLVLALGLGGCGRPSDDAAALPAVELAAAPAPLRERVAAVQERALTDGAALGELAQLYHANGYTEAAEAAYRRLQTLAPDEARWPYLGAVLVSGYGRNEEALEGLRRAAVLAPGYAPIHLKRGDVALKLNQPAEAAAAFGQIGDDDPAWPWAEQGLARLAAMDGRWPEVRRRLERVVARFPGFFAGHSLLATAYERMGETAAAGAARRRARAAERFREPPDPWVEALSEYCYDVYRLQVQAAAAEDPVRQRRLLERALELEPTNGKTMRQLALAHLDAGQVAEARAWIDRALAQAPDEPGVYLDLVPIYHAQQDRAGAERRLQEGLERAPEAAGLHYELAMIAIADERVGEAVERLETARRLEPTQLAAYSKLAAQYFRLGRDAEAVAVLAAALEQDPMNLDALLLLARYHVLAGEREAAQAYLDRATRAGAAGAEWENVQREFAARFGRGRP